MLTKCLQFFTHQIYQFVHTYILAFLPLLNTVPITGTLSNASGTFLNGLTIGLGNTFPNALPTFSNGLTIGLGRLGIAFPSPPPNSPLPPPWRSIGVDLPDLLDLNQAFHRVPRNSPMPRPLEAPMNMKVTYKQNEFPSQFVTKH